MTSNTQYITRSGLKLQKLTRHSNGTHYICKKWHLRLQHNRERRWIPLDENPKSAEKKANDLVRVLDSSDGHTMTINEALKQLEHEGLRIPIRPASLRKASSLGELQDTVEMTAANLGIVLDTAREYSRSIVTIVGEVVRRREGPGPKMRKRDNHVHQHTRRRLWAV